MPELLVVDDDPAVSAALAVRARSHGMTVSTACDALQALAITEEWTPDVVVLDIRMPGISGIELCRRLRDNASTAGVPVVFLSAETSEATREAALLAGGQRFISKPYRASHLFHEIQEVLGSQ